MSHTPGPWKVYSRGKTRAEHIEFEKSYWVGFGETEWKGPGTIVDMVNPIQGLLAPDLIEKNEVEARANAHLIAAAPELLEACEFLAGIPNIEVPHLVLEQIQALIKRAKGEDPGRDEPEDFGKDHWRVEKL
jgi:hypothetical protein